MARLGDDSYANAGAVLLNRNSDGGMIRKAPRIVIKGGNWLKLHHRFIPACFSHPSKSNYWLLFADEKGKKVLPRRSTDSPVARHANRQFVHCLENIFWMAIQTSGANESRLVQTMCGSPGVKSNIHPGASEFHFFFLVRQFADISRLPHNTQTKYINIRPSGPLQLILLARYQSSKDWLLHSMKIKFQFSDYK